MQVAARQGLQGAGHHKAPVMALAASQVRCWQCWQASRHGIQVSDCHQLHTRCSAVPCQPSFQLVEAVCQCSSCAPVQLTLSEFPFLSPALPCRPDINKRLGGVLAIDELIDVKVSLGWQQQREANQQGLWWWAEHRGSVLRRVMAGPGAVSGSAPGLW